MNAAAMFLLLLVGAASAPAASVLGDGVLPTPRVAEAREGPGLQLGVETTESWSLTAPDEAAAGRLAGQLRESLRDGGLNENVCVGASIATEFRLAHHDARELPREPTELPEEGGDEGYQIDVSASGVSVTARAEAGLFYGIMTLEQLVRHARLTGQPIPAGRIVDWPALRLRGYHEDYGRDQLPTVEDHKRTIRTLAKCKMNAFIWYTEPDHFVYSFDPELGKGCDRFTFDEVRELVAYAKRYHVEIIPLVELLGHCERMLADPRYARLAEVPGGSDLCPTSDEAFGLVSKIVAEVSAAFDSAYFHCGLDETYSIGQGKSAEAVKERGLASVIADYYSRLDALVRSHGKTAVMYADIALAHPDILAALPRDIVMMDWDYAPRERYPGLAVLRDAGFRTMSLSSSWAWNNLYPPCPVAFANMRTFAKQSAEAGSLGHFVSTWGDTYGLACGQNLSEMNSCILAYCGAVSWNPDAPPSDDTFPAEFAESFFGSDSAELAHALDLLARCQEPGWSHDQQPRALLHSDLVADAFACGAEGPEAGRWWRSMRRDAAAAHHVLSATRVPLNGDYLRVIDLCARMLVYSGDLEEACRGIGATVVAGKAFPETERIRWAGVFEELLGRYDALWEDYSAAYLATNRPLNLARIELNWDAMRERFRRLVSDIRSGVFPPSVEPRTLLNLDFQNEAPLKPVAPSAEAPRMTEGANAYIHLPSGSCLTLADPDRRLATGYAPLRVELRIRHTGQRQQQYGSTVLCYGTPGRGWRLALDSSGRLTFTIFGVLDLVGPNSVVPPDGAWHTVGVTFTECQRVRYYVDGKQSDDLIMRGVPTPDANPRLLLGDDPSRVTPFEGDVDDVQIAIP